MKYYFRRIYARCKMQNESVKNEGEILQSSVIKVSEDQVEQNEISEENVITNAEDVTPQNSLIEANEEKVKQNEIFGGNIITNVEDVIRPNPLIKAPGDKLEQYKTPTGNVITKVDTTEINFTHRQYNKKDGSKGKQTITFKQINDK